MHILPVFVILCLSFSINTEDTPGPIELGSATGLEIGESGCRYNGDTRGCVDDSRMSVSDLPIACSSWHYNGLIVLPNGVIKPRDAEIIKELGGYKQPFYLFYQHESLFEWTSALKKPDIDKELESIVSYLADYEVDGLTLAQLEYDEIKYNTNSIPPPNFSDQITSFVKQLKLKKTNLQVGLYVSARNLIFYDGCLNPWFDFSTLSSVMDYYIINFCKFNVCEEAFLQGGIIPIDIPRFACNPNTLNLLEKALNFFNLDKKKLYFEFFGSPVIPDFTMEFPLCDVSYTQYCAKDNIKKFYWCTENSTTCFNKGNWAKKHGNGIIVKFIDTIDRKETCECNGGKYMTFYYMIDGFKGNKQPECHKMDSFPYTLFSN